jgi:proteasome lid subunit RPN8/RPN11
MRAAQLIVPGAVLRDTLAGLRDRSAGWRESAAIWAGDVQDERWSAREVMFHHELCDDHGGPLSLELSEAAKFNLYRELAERGLRLVSLVHTHPHQWVDLSPVDQANQLSSRVGFWSVVIPDYAVEPWDIPRMGFHVRTHRGWRRLTPSAMRCRVVIED